MPALDYERGIGGQARSDNPVVYCLDSPIKSGNDTLFTRKFVAHCVLPREPKNPHVTTIFYS